METVSFELIRKIYNHINRTEKITSLLSNRQKWDRLTSALNVLEDTSWAIEYYLGNDYPSEFKESTYIPMDFFKRCLCKEMQ